MPIADVGTCSNGHTSGLRFYFRSWIARCRFAWKTLTCHSCSLQRISAAFCEQSSQPVGQQLLVDKAYLDQLETQLKQLRDEREQAIDHLEILERQRSELNDIGLTFLNRIDCSLNSASEVTEKAALSIGSNVSRLFEIASQDNQLASETLVSIVGDSHDDSDMVSPRGQLLSEVILEQEQSTERFVTHAQQFFEAQSQAATNVRDACVAMRECVAKVDQLVFSSELLSFNIRCEAVRLGNDGSPFAVLAEEMVRFSQAIKTANLAINQSLGSLSERMNAYYDDSQIMKKQIDTFADDLGQQIRRVQEKTQQLTETFETTLQHISASNGNLMRASQNALSELQFQDPLVQDLRRTLHETYKLRQLITSGSAEDTHLADIDPTVGSGQALDQEPGIVALF